MKVQFEVRKGDASGVMMVAVTNEDETAYGLYIRIHDDRWPTWLRKKERKWTFKRLSDLEEQIMEANWQGATNGGEA